MRDKEGRKRERERSEGERKRERSTELLSVFQLLSVNHGQG